MKIPRFLHNNHYRTRYVYKISLLRGRLYGIFPAEVVDMKFKHTYFNEVGCPVLVQGEIGRTPNSKGYSFSLTNEQKTAIAKLLQAGRTVLFDGYDYRRWTGLYGYPKHEISAARFIVDGNPVSLEHKRSETWRKLSGRRKW